ncbi:hypothetical protein LT493_19580 [Streptomyces tricolor]|nr:hypothetical protein [Streptomyces tricolor]
MDQLTPGAGTNSLDRALRIADPEDDRVVEEPEAAARLAELCGYLPLALQIAVALLAEDPGKAVAELADELGTSYDRLAALDDGDRSVRAAFDLSYRRLPAGQARLLSLLALAPGPEASEEVAAVLAGGGGAAGGGPEGAGPRPLGGAGNSRGCWRMHDLVRAFGAGVAAGDPEARTQRASGCLRTTTGARMRRTTGCSGCRGSGAGTLRHAGRGSGLAGQRVRRTGGRCSVGSREAVRRYGLEAGPVLVVVPGLASELRRLDWRQQCRPGGFARRRRP